MRAMRGSTRRWPRGGEERVRIFRARGYRSKSLTCVKNNKEIDVPA